MKQARSIVARENTFGNHKRSMVLTFLKYDDDGGGDDGDDNDDEDDVILGLVTFCFR